MSESMEDLVRRIIRSVQAPTAQAPTAQVPTAQAPTTQGQQNNQNFQSEEDEINHRFNMPRRTAPQVEAPVEASNSSQSRCTSTGSLGSQYNSQENYGYNSRRQRRRVPYSRNRVSRQPAPKTRMEPPSLKEVILLPKPSCKEVPKYKKKAELQQKHLIVDSLPVEKWWSESQLRQRIQAVFETELLSSGIQVGFDFVKVIGSSLHPINLPRGTELTAKVLLGIVKQRPVYVRARYNLDGESDNDIDDDDDDLPCVLATTKGGDCSTLLPERSQPSVVVQAEGTDGRPDRNNSILPFVIRQPSATSTQQDPIPVAESSNTCCTLGNKDCVEQLAMIFPDISGEYLERTFQTCDHDMQRAVSAILSAQQAPAQSTEDLPLSIAKDTPAVALVRFQEKMVAPNYLRQPIRVTRFSETLIRDVFRDFKRNAIDVRKEPDVIFTNEEGIDARGPTREYCHMVMASLRDGAGGIVLFEGMMDHLLPVHCNAYVASSYFKYAGQMIAHSVIHAGFGMIGMSRALVKYIQSDDMQDAIPYLTVDDVPDKTIQDNLKKLQDAVTEDDVTSIAIQDDMSQLLTRAGFVNELTSTSNKHRACQCILTHIVFKERREEMKQLEEGLESLSLITFLQVSEGCIKYVFPLQGEVKVTAEDFISQFANGWQDDKEGDEEPAKQWFAEYVQEVADGKGTWTLMDLY